MIIDVDFDGTLCDSKYPDIGEPNIHLVNYLRKRKLKGDKLILFTMREGEDLEEALIWCDGMGLKWDAVNDNLPIMQERFGNNPRKVFADYYIDDRNALCGIGRKLPR